jgi:hypothetical protein
MLIPIPLGNRIPFVQLEPSHFPAHSYNNNDDDDDDDDDSHKLEERWATGWTIGVLGFDSRRRLGIFLFITASRTALGPTQPPIQWVQGALSLEVKRPRCETVTHLHLMPRSKNGWSCASTPQYAFMAWCSVKAQLHLYFYLYL